MEEGYSDIDYISTYEDDPNDSDYEVEKINPKPKKNNRENNGKWKFYYHNRRFRKEWTSLFPWVEEDPDDPKFAICRACNKKIKAHKGILETHQKTKKHLRNLSGSDDIEDEEDIKPEIAEKRTGPRVHSVQSITNEEYLAYQASYHFFNDSQTDTSQHEITDAIDKLVGKYHETRIQNLKEQRETMENLNQTRTLFNETERQLQKARRITRAIQSREIKEMKMKFQFQEHELKMKCMDRVRDAKLKVVEQQLMFTRQEYEKKVKLLDHQLQSIK